MSNLKKTFNKDALLNTVNKPTGINQKDFLPVGTWLYSDQGLFVISSVEKSGVRYEGAERKEIHYWEYHITEFGSDYTYTRKDATQPNVLEKWAILPSEWISLSGDEVIERIKKEFMSSVDSGELVKPVNSSELVSQSIGRDKLNFAMKTAGEQKNRALMLTAHAKILANEIMQTVREQRAKITNLLQILGLLEAYIGVGKEFFIVKDGNPAADSEKTHIRQRVLFANEEVGDLTRYQATDQWGNDHFWSGIGYEDMDKFDAWLLENDNYKNVVPEQKCIVAVRPRRHAGWDGRSKVDSLLHLIVRNGERVYRVTMPDIIVGYNLFPASDDWDKLLEEIRELEEKEDLYGYDAMRKRSKQIAIMKGIAFIQGLINEGEILMSEPVNLFSPDSHQNAVVVVRDGEGSLGNGAETYREWRKRLLGNIKLGSRIVIPDVELRKYIGYNEDMKDRFSDQYRYDGYSLPTPPRPGTYTIEREFDSGYYRFGFLYLPSDEIYINGYDNNGDWIGYKKRTRRVAFRFSSDDEFIFPYDGVTLEDVERFLGDRSQRHEYATMLPVLYALATQIRRDYDAEKDFVALVANECNVDLSVVWDAVDWWKNKVKLYRPLNSDSEKAWRMIRKHIL